jgi:hypothetical protein
MVDCVSFDLKPLFCFFTNIYFLKHLCDGFQCFPLSCLCSQPSTTSKFSHDSFRLLGPLLHILVILLDWFFRPSQASCLFFLMHLYGIFLSFISNVIYNIDIFLSFGEELFPRVFSHFSPVIRVFRWVPYQTLLSGTIFVLLSSSLCFSYGGVFILIISIYKHMTIV